jgi:hypothetical protein
MTSVAAALRRHAPRYLLGLANCEANVAIRKTLSAIMQCRTGALGGVQWQCEGCGRSHWAGRSCGNRHCSTCGADKTHDWLVKQSGKLLPGVHHFLVTFTVPQELREVLRVHPRAGYEALFAAAAASLHDVGSATRQIKGCKLGFFGVLHTWGRDPLVYHPHVHFVVPGGGVAVDEAGQATGWQQTPTNFFVHHGTLIKVYQAKLADELRDRALYDLVPAAAWRKKFVVDVAPVADGRSAVAYLAPYVQRVAISDRRIKQVDEQSVTYQYQPSKTKTLKTRTVTGQQFVAGFAQHILPTRFQKVRHYGWMSNHSKIRGEEVRILVWMMLGWVYWLASGRAPQPKPAKQATLRCAVCGGQMHVVMIINAPLPAAFLNRGRVYLDSS